MTGSQRKSLERQDSGGPVRTLSGAWSKIMAKAMAEVLSDNEQDNTAAAAAAQHSRDTAAGAIGGHAMCSRGSSDESVLTASDAVVHLMPVGKFRLISGGKS